MGWIDAAMGGARLIYAATVYLLSSLEGRVIWPSLFS